VQQGEIDFSKTLHFLYLSEQRYKKGTKNIKIIPTNKNIY